MEQDRGCWGRGHGWGRSSRLGTLHLCHSLGPSRLGQPSDPCPLLFGREWWSQAGRLQLAWVLFLEPQFCPLWQTEALSAPEVSRLAPHCGSICLAPQHPIPDQHPLPTSRTCPLPRSHPKSWTESVRHFSPEPLLSLGWGAVSRCPLLQTVLLALQGPGCRKRTPRHTLHAQPPCHPAPTLRDETVARSMSGELAIILWAARTPAGTEFLPQVQS